MKTAANTGDATMTEIATIIDRNRTIANLGAELAAETVIELRACNPDLDPDTMIAAVIREGIGMGGHQSMKAEIDEPTDADWALLAAVFEATARQLVMATI